MAEYINREAVLNFIEHNDKVCHYADERYENVVYATAQTICKVVAEMPAADVQPVKRGKWKHVAGMNSKCSVCSHYFPVSEFDSRPFDINFCPNCGARMDGDAE